MERDMNADVTLEDTAQQVDRLREEHQALERRLEEMDKLVYLTPEEQIERKRIQKTKLQKKDMIQALQKKLST